MPHTELIVNGERWPSVTEIIGTLQKPGLENWREAVGEEKANEISHASANRGRQFHGLIEKFLRGEAVSFCGEDSLRDAFKVWFAWWQEGTYICVDQELKVISKKLKYGGTLDAVLRNKESKLGIVDWKLSNSDDPLRAFQLAAYAIAYEEQTSKNIDFGMIVRIEMKRDRHKVLTPRLCTPWIYTDLNLYKVMFKALVKEFNKKK